MESGRSKPIDDLGSFDLVYDLRLEKTQFAKQRLMTTNAHRKQRLEQILSDQNADPLTVKESLQADEQVANQSMQIIATQTSDSNPR